MYTCTNSGFDGASRTYIGCWSIKFTFNWDFMIPFNRPCTLNETDVLDKHKNIHISTLSQRLSKHNSVYVCSFTFWLNWFVIYNDQYKKKHKIKYKKQFFAPVKT